MSLEKLRLGLVPGGSVTTQLLTRIGLHLVRRAQGRFDSQGDEEIQWRPRSVPNVPGILRDAETSGTAKGRRFEERPAGLDTGALRASYSYTVGPDWVEIGSSLDYAKRFERGGTETIAITPTMRANVALMVKRQANALGDKLGWFRLIARGHVSSVTVGNPPRPVKRVTPEDWKEFLSWVPEELAS